MWPQFVSNWTMFETIHIHSSNIPLLLTSMMNDHNNIDSKYHKKKANIIIMQRINCLWSSLILFRLLLYLENIDMLKRQIELIRWKKTEVIYWFGKTIDKIRSIHLIKIKIMLKSILLVKWWSILLGKWSLIIGQMCLLRIKNGYCSSQITIQIYKSTHYNFSESIEGPKIVIK